MKILHTVESFFPARHGMAEVVRQLSELMAQAGHEVTVATSYDPNRSEVEINGVKIKSFNISGNLVRGIKGDARAYRDFILSNNFDVIANFAAQQWATDLCFDLLPLLTCKKIFIPTGFSALYNPKYNGYFNHMKRWMNLYDMHVFLSNDYRDIQFARDARIKNWRVVPNGASQKEFDTESDFSIRQLLKIPASGKLILHVGSYSGLKGHDQALSIFRKSQYQQKNLVFVGENLHSYQALSFLTRTDPLALLKTKISLNKQALKQVIKSINYLTHDTAKSDHVHLMHVDRKLLIQIFKEADLLLFPSMIECSPLVLFEAMASRTPFLVTDVGNSREIIEWTGGGDLLPTRIGKDGFSYADIELGAKKLDSLLENEVQLKKLAEAGYQSWIEKFTWEKLAQDYLNIYSS